MWRVSGFVLYRSPCPCSGCSRRSPGKPQVRLESFFKNSARIPCLPCRCSGQLSTCSMRWKPYGPGQTAMEEHCGFLPCVLCWWYSGLGEYLVVPKDQLPEGLFHADSSKLVCWIVAHPSSNTLCEKAGLFWTRDKATGDQAQFPCVPGGSCRLIALTLMYVGWSMPRVDLMSPPSESSLL